MRKITMILLCLLLIVTPAFAEVFTSNTGMFTFELPEDYIPLTGELVDEMLNGEMSGEIQKEMENMGFDSDVVAEMFEEFQGVDFSMLDYIYTPDFTGNVNIYVQEGIGLTQEMLPLVESMLDEQMVPVYMSMGAAEEDCVSQGVQTIGSNVFYAIYVTMPGDITMHQYMTFTEDGDQIVITFTDFPEEVENVLVESFELL